MTFKQTVTYVLNSEAELNTMSDEYKLKLLIRILTVYLFNRKKLYK